MVKERMHKKIQKHSHPCGKLMRVPARARDPQYSRQKKDACVAPALSPSSKLYSAFSFAASCWIRKKRGSSSRSESTTSPGEPLAQLDGFSMEIDWFSIGFPWIFNINQWVSNWFSMVSVALREHPCFTRRGPSIAGSRGHR